jgi:DeoR family transcriptional regulator, fructose operon transcriptional repressor
MAILEEIESRKKVTVSDLSVRLGVSGATIRSDLRELEQRGQLLRTHGGAIPRAKAGFELGADERRVQNAELKGRIAWRALDLVEDGDTIVVDTGSTSSAFAALLHRRRNLTVVTNDLAIALAVDEVPDTGVVIVGGRLRKRFQCTVGTSASQMLAGLTVDKAFMGANGFSLEMGATTPDLQQAEMKRLLVGIATKVVLLVDSTKIGRNSFVQFAPAEGIDCIVTDFMSEDQQRALEETEIEVCLAPAARTSSNDE